MVEQLVADVPEPQWSAKVVEVRDGVVFLNAGADGDVSAGQVLEVYEIQPPLIDPDTGKNLGAPDKLLGEIQIETVQAGFSTAKVMTGAGFARNNVVGRDCLVRGRPAVFWRKTVMRPLRWVPMLMAMVGGFSPLLAQAFERPTGSRSPTIYHAGPSSG